MRVLSRQHRDDDLQNRLRDDRSRKVAFVSHCLLNQNVRYLGGATRPAMIDTVVDDLRRRQIGIVQMPCPEQAVWGGVIKRRMLGLYGARWARSRVGHWVVPPVVRLWTRFRYRRLARGIARDIADYTEAGFEVTEIIGVGSSPSCGITTTIDLGGAIDAMARCEPGRLTRETVNAKVVRANTTSGRGLFMDALVERLASRGITVPIRQHDLLAELGFASSAPADVIANADPGRLRMRGR